MAKDNEPLGLPDGSIRAIMAFGIIATSFAVFVFTNKLAFEGLLALIGTPLSLYFGQYMTAPGASVAPVVHAVVEPVAQAVAPAVQTLEGVQGAVGGVIDDLTGGLK